jgi:uncharacterized protein with GYD domain
MPKYLFQGSYTGEGVNGVVKEGGSKRREATEQLVQGLGGTLEAYYFAFGDDDFFAIVDLPDNVTVAAASLVAAASGAVNAKTIVLITPEEIDQAVKMSVDYRPPGH